MRITTLIGLFTLITAKEETPIHRHLRIKNSEHLKDFLNDSNGINNILYISIVVSIIVSIILSKIYFSKKKIKKVEQKTCENYKNRFFINYNFDLENNPNTTLYYMIRERNALKSKS
jgi:hypothetical protein